MLSVFFYATDEGLPALFCIKCVLYRFIGADMQQQALNP